MLLQALKLFIPHNWILIVATILTILIAWIGTSFLAYPLQKLVYGFYGWISTNFKNNHSLVIQDGDPWETILDETRSDKTNVYFFTLNHKPISAGRLYAYSSDEISNYQAVVYPFKDVPLESYEKLHERVMNNKFQEEHLTYEYINTKQNFIVVITYPRSKL